MTHDQFLGEPAATVDWFLQFERIDLEVEATLTKRAQKER